MSAETHLSELCRGSDIDAIVTRLRQVAPLDEAQASSDAQSSGQPDRYGMWGYQDNDGRTALHWAIALKNFDLAKTLMHAPYNSPVLTEDEEWTTPFATACSVGAPIELLQELLDKSVAELDGYVAWKAQHAALRETAPKAATSAAAEKLTVPAPAAAAAAAAGNVEVQKSEGAPLQREVPGVANPADDTPEAAVSAIIDSEDATGLTPLLFAAGRGHSNIVRFLVEHGANLNHQNHRGQSALHRAVNCGNMDLVEYIVTASQKRNGTNRAAQRRFLDLQDFHGDSALFYASMDNNEEMGRYLLRHGADRDLRNKDGKNFWEV